MNGFPQGYVATLWLLHLQDQESGSDHPLTALPRAAVRIGGSMCTVHGTHGHMAATNKERLLLYNMRISHGQSMA